MPLPHAPALPQQLDIIDGEPCEPADELPGWLDDPNTGVHLARQRSTAADEVDRAVRVAAHAHRSGAIGAGAATMRHTLLGAIAKRLGAEDVVESTAVADSANTGPPPWLPRDIAGTGGRTCRAPSASTGHTPRPRCAR